MCGLLTCVLLLPLTLNAQQRYSFVIDRLNVIHDKTGTLKPLMQLLQGLKNFPENKSIVSIIHIGDSHLQAGFITKVIRVNLQKSFGNAGRGLVVPLKLAGTNQPRDYSISSDEKWEGARMVQRNQPYIFGLSGIAIQTSDSNYELRLETYPDSANELDYRFNRVTVFHSNASYPEVKDSWWTEVLSPYAYSINLKWPTDILQLKERNSSKLPQTYHAFSLENGHGGVLYHTVGVNGAQYKDYSEQALFFQQLSVLAPKLIVISLGTNESFGRSFSTSAFTEEMDEFMYQLRKANPHAAFILTTPAEDYRLYQRKRIPNERIALVRNAIVRYAESAGIAYWDCFEATGGKGSCAQWNKNDLMANDQVHFNAAGYELQGELFTQAFMKLYNTYTTAGHGLE